MDHTKLDRADLDSPRRELSVHGLGFLVSSIKKTISDIKDVLSPNIY